jgi:tetraacyldisaccharide 4'-kinase
LLDQAKFLGIISGADRSWRASAIRGLLWFLAIGYRIVIWFRNQSFSRGWRRATMAPLPIWSIGNLTTGGTGKTPHVIWLAQWLRDRGQRVAILSRGYGAGPHQTENDEARELAQRLPDVPNLIDPLRCRSAELAFHELEMELALLDDGFQHRQLHRDLDIVLVDLLQLDVMKNVLPRGLLREPWSSLRRADVVILTRSDAVDSKVLDATRRRVQRWAPQSLIVQSRTRPVCWQRSDGTQRPLESLAGERVGLVCAVGSPHAVAQQVRELGLQVLVEEFARDHHDWSPAELVGLAERGAAADLQAWVCTAKDLVKLQRARLGTVPLWSLIIDIELTTGREELEALLEQRLRPTRPTVGEDSNPRHSGDESLATP